MASDNPDPTDVSDDRGLDPAVIPSEDEQGKSVVDRNDREIGMVSTVEGDTMYVDPHPDLTDEISAALGWDDKSEDDLPVPPGFVENIGDEVVLEVDRDEEYQERTS